MLGNLSHSLMSIIDVAMVGRLGAPALAAVGLGSMMAFAVSAFLNAIQSSVQTLVARREGEGQPAASAQVLRIALYFSAVAGGLTALLFVWTSAYIFPLINPDANVVFIGIDYLRYRGFSLLPITLGYAFYGFYNGISRPRIHLIVSVVANTTNVILNYGLIFGRLGLPAMGAPGAGLATTISESLALGLYILATLSANIRK